MNSMAASMLSRSFVGPSRLGLLCQPAAAQPVLCQSFFRPASVQPRARSFHLSAPPRFRHSGRNGSSSSSFFKGSFSPWYVAAAIPLVAVQGDAPAYETPPRRRPLSSYSRYDLPMNPEFAAEVSKGSVIGFAIGLLVSTFSKSLVLLLGLGITLQSMASQAGIDLVQYLKLKERFTSSRIIDALAEHTAFKLAFGICFMLSSVFYF